jgi:hypothetical protein
MFAMEPPLISVPPGTDWTPLKRWTDPFAGFARPRPPDEDVWQFSTFLVHGPA